MVTQFQPAANFDDYVTFSIDPTVAVVDETGSVSQTFTVDGANLVPTIGSNMREELHRGRVERKRRADLHIKMSATLGNVDTYSYYPGYCGWYPYYYCYPSWSYEASYNFGSLVLTMGDVKNAAPGGGGKLRSVWTSSARGVLSDYYTPGVPSGGANVNWARIRESIDRAFADSPYIQRTP